MCAPVSWLDGCMDLASDICHIRVSQASLLFFRVITGNPWEVLEMFLIFMVCASFGMTFSIIETRAAICTSPKEIAQSSRSAISSFNVAEHVEGYRIRRQVQRQNYGTWPYAVLIATLCAQAQDLAGFCAYSPTSKITEDNESAQTSSVLACSKTHRIWEEQMWKQKVRTQHKLYVFWPRHFCFAAFGFTQHQYSSSQNNSNFSQKASTRLLAH